MGNFSFSFNGIRKNFVFCEEDGREQSMFAPVTRNLFTIPGLPGALLESTETQIRVIRQRIFYQGTAGKDLRKLEEEISAWLLTEEPVPLIFDDETDRIYYAAVDGSFDIEESLKVGGGTITFICPDPYKYGAEKTVLWPAQETVKADFAGKVAGSTVENPHIAKYAYQPTLQAPASFLGEASTGDYANISTLNSVVGARITIVNGNMAQQLLSFNLIELVEREYGVLIPGSTTADKVAWLKVNVTKLVIDWWGRGSGPAGSKAYLAIWDAPNNAYKPNSVNSSTYWPRVGTSASVTKLNGSESQINNAIDSNGFVHFIAYAEASNGTIASTIEIDYLELLITLNLQHLPSTIDYKGTAETFPIIKAEVTKATPYIAIENQTTGEMMMIGQPVSVEDTVVPYEETILDDTMATLTGWANASFAVDGGQIAGSMQSDSYVFKAQNYGTGSAWHGPAVAKSLSQQLQDFRVDTIIKFSSTNVLEVGRLEIHLLDINNTVIGKLAMKDYMGNYIFNMPEIFAINKPANKVESLIVRNANENWNGFYGMLRFQRIGQEISAYISRINANTGLHESVKVGSFQDSNNQYQTKVAAIGIHIATFGPSAPMSTAQVHHLTVKKINANQPGIPYIALPGDIVEIDLLKESITRNGEDIKDLKAFIAKFFPLVKGINELAVAPADSLKLESKYRERFK